MKVNCLEGNVNFMFTFLRDMLTLLGYVNLFTFLLQLRFSYILKVNKSSSTLVAVLE